jgi:hypothetical protein
MGLGTMAGTVHRLSGGQGSEAGRCMAAPSLMVSKLRWAEGPLHALPSGLDGRPGRRALVHSRQAGFKPDCCSMAWRP